MEKYKSLFKNIGLFAIGSFGSKLISFLMLPLYTSILSTTDYGTVDIISTTTQLLIPILLLSIADAVLRFSMDPKYKKQDVISSAFKVTCIGSLFLIIGCLILGLTSIILLPIIYWAFLVFSFILNASVNCSTIYLKSKNEAGKIAIGGIICTLVTCVANFYFLVVAHAGVNGYMLSMVLGMIAQMLYYLFATSIFKDVHIKKYNNVSKEMISYSAPLIPNSLAWWINNASDRYIIAWLAGAAANGIYAVAYKIPTMLAMFQGIFYNAWSISAIAEYDKDDKDGFLGNNYELYSFVSMFACCAAMIVVKPLATVLFRGDYYNAWQYVPFLLVSTVFSGMSQFEGSMFAATKKTKAVALTTILGAAINTICNIIFIPWMGALGAALATMAGYFVMWLSRTISMRKFLKMKVDWGGQLLATVVLLTQAVFSTIGGWYIVQALLMVSIIWINRRNISKVLKRANGLKDKITKNARH